MVHRVAGGDCDVIGLHREGFHVTVALLFVREGKLTGSRSFTFPAIAEDDMELIQSFLLQNYNLQDSFVSEILLPLQLENESEVEDLLKEQLGKQVSLVYPKRGDKKNLLEMACKNAEANFKKENDLQTSLDRALSEMQERFS